MAITSFQCYFMGSFQCRLATEPALTGATVKAPSACGDFRLGWAFDSGEAALDRVLQFSKPLALREDRLISPWQDTTVYGAEVDRGKGPASVPVNDPLIGVPLSVGSHARAGKGSNSGKEVLAGFELNLGGLLKASGNPEPGCISTWSHRLQQTCRDVYKAVNFQHLNAHFYSIMGKVEDARLETPIITAKSGVLAEVRKQMKPQKPGVWKVTLFLWQFDGDTLVGGTFGILTAKF